MKMFKDQFIGKRTWLALGAIVIIHLLSILGSNTLIGPVALIGIAILVLFIAMEKLENGLYIAFAELFVGGHGHLLHIEVLNFSLSLRMAIFLSVMLAWLVLLLRKKISIQPNLRRDLPWILLAVALLIGSLVGFTTNEFREAFDDMNGYLLAAYFLPIISLKWNGARKRGLMQVLAASAIWLVFFTLLLSFLFSHLQAMNLTDVYSFVRDARLAEVTLQTVSDSDGNIVNPYAAKFFGQEGYWYRIFMQNHLITTVVLLLLISGLVVWQHKKKRILWVSLFIIALISVLPLSMSRSFLVALGAAGVFLIGALTIHIRPKVIDYVRSTLTLTGATFIALVLAWISIVIPIATVSDITNAAFYKTSADATRELAISSRWQLLGPMNQEIYASPIIGSGFGEEVTFISDDPRVREENPTGEWTTYRFEWGYQDIWLKMGIMGLIAFATYLLLLSKAVLNTLKNKNDQWIVIGLYAGVICLFVAHVFTPFLNHPIGIAWMLFVIPFVSWKFEQTESFRIKRSKRVLITGRTPSPAMRTTK